MSGRLDRWTGPIDTAKFPRRVTHQKDFPRGQPMSIVNLMNSFQGALLSGLSVLGNRFVGAFLVALLVGVVSIRLSVPYCLSLTNKTDTPIKGIKTHVMSCPNAC